MRPRTSVSTATRGGVQGQATGDDPLRNLDAEGRKDGTVPAHTIWRATYPATTSALNAVASSDTASAW
jgi:hypothetical protein